MTSPDGSSPGLPIRVLVVDDSATVRRLMTTVLDREPFFEVAGTASDGADALAAIRRHAPDAVTLDIEMPRMDGLTTLRGIRREFPTLPVVMVSTLTERGARITLEALASGANDYIAKPSGSITESLEHIRTQLLPRIRAFVERERTPRAAPPPRIAPVADLPAGPVPAGAPSPPAPALPAAVPTAGDAPVAAPPRARPGRPDAKEPPTVPAVRRAVTGAAPAPRLAPVPTSPVVRRVPKRVDVVVIGSSTGGPEALPVVLRRLPPTLPVPVVVVQHMPPMFTTMLAQRLDAALPLHVVEAGDGVVLQPGTVYIAPGDRHVILRRSAGRVISVLDDGPPENFCRPAVDVLFRSAAETYGAAALAVVLTGMGADGARAARDLVEAGAELVAQDEETSVVWGMPGAVARAGLAHRVLPLEQIGDDVCDVVNRGRRPQTVSAR